MKNQFGFLIAGLVFVLPLMALALITTLSLKAFLVPEFQTTHICQDGLLRTQEKAAKSIHAVLKLNPLIQALRVDRAGAQAALEGARATGVPPAIAAAELHLQAVIASQTELQIVQRGLLIEGQSVLQKGLFETLIELRSQFQNQASKYHQSSPFFYIHLLRVIPSPGQLGLQPIPSDQPGPSQYKLNEHYSEDQKLRISWSFTWSRNSTTGVLWNAQKLIRENSCAASLVKVTNAEAEPVRLRSVLMVDKSSWKGS